MSKRHLASLCETRFLEQHTAIVTFRLLFSFVVQALEEMTVWQSEDAAQSAANMLAAIRSFDSIIGMMVLEKVASILLPVSRRLQAADIELSTALSDVLHSEEKFLEIFEGRPAGKHEIPIQLPPRLRRAKNMQADCGNNVLKNATKAVYFFQPRMQLLRMFDCDLDHIRSKRSILVACCQATFWKSESSGKIFKKLLPSIRVCCWIPSASCSRSTRCGAFSGCTSRLLIGLGVL